MGITTLLERECELQELCGALSEAQEERGQLVLIEGEAGLGKTSLLRVALETAGESGLSCLRGGRRVMQQGRARSGDSLRTSDGGARGEGVQQRGRDHVATLRFTQT